MDETTLAEGDNTDQIIGAIRRIMSADEEMPTGEPGTGTFSKQARERIFAALGWLTGDDERPPTVLEALILEKLDPLLQDWLDRNLPPLVERLMREEIQGLVQMAVAQNESDRHAPAETPAETEPTT